MVAIPTTTKDSLQTDLNSVLATVEGKLDAATAQKIKQAMDRLLEQDNKFNREILVSAVDELLIIGDSKELHKDEIKKILKFLESLKDFLTKGLKNLYEYDNILKAEQRKVKDRIEDVRETQRIRFGR
jgi:allophanate hydrolase subunit 1